ncbi:MAG TPA: GNAT family N-acetyltransferase, partial [Vicinamibacteria bacterium]|nr:GNAT family N-acetyltransferase [Vicinamibacteria bacterium]
MNPIIEGGNVHRSRHPVHRRSRAPLHRELPPEGDLSRRRGSSRWAARRISGCMPFADYTHAFDHVGVIGTFVSLPHRRQGIAGRLFRSTFEAARLKGYEKFFTFIRADNPAALATYRRHGFEVI